MAALIVVMKAFCSKGCFPRGRIILSLCRDTEVVSVLLQGHGSLQRIPTLMAPFPHALQIWLELRVFIFVCVCDSVLHLISKSSNIQRKHLPLETNEKDHLCCVSHRNIFFFSCWTKFFTEQCQALKLLSLLNFQ